MVSYSGYWQYQDIIQAERPAKKVCIYNQNTIMGYISSNPDYTLFTWMIKKAEMDLKMYHELFDSTLFIVNDANLRKQVGEDAFVTMDKNTAINLLNAHLLDKKIHKKTLMSQRLTRIFTKNQKTEIMFLNNNGNVTLNNMSKLIKEDIIVSNGVMHEVEYLILPFF